MRPFLGTALLLFLGVACTRCASGPSAQPSQVAAAPVAAGPTEVSPPGSGTPTAPPLAQDPTTTEPPPVRAPDLPPAGVATTGSREAQGKACAAGGSCPDGLTCVRYYGVAGRAGGELSSCELPCKGAREGCPENQHCVTIADGPGRVCRPGSNPAK